MKKSNRFGAYALKPFSVFGTNKGRQILPYDRTNYLKSHDKIHQQVRAYRRRNRGRLHIDESSVGMTATNSH